MRVAKEPNGSAAVHTGYFYRRRSFLLSRIFVLKFLEAKRSGQREVGNFDEISENENLLNYQFCCTRIVVVLRRLYVPDKKFSVLGTLGLFETIFHYM